MKRIGNLYDSICEMDNIYLAYNKARMGKSKSHGVIIFEKNLDENLAKTQKELSDGAYRISPYEVFKIYEPKERIIYRLPFYDRVVQHAIMNIIEPIWVSLFISQTYSCIKNRGIHGVLKHIKRDLKEKEDTKYCLKMDIKKFYPSINHEIMKKIIRKKIKDKKLLGLLDHIIDSAPGLPIGNYLSQFLSNLYMTYFDHWLKEEQKVKYYYRYADDIVILAENKSYLHALFIQIEEYLSGRLKLEIKKDYQVFPVKKRGIDFVGYVFRHTHILMRKSIKQNFCRKVAKLNKRNISAEEYKQSICSWLGWAKHCNSRNLLKTIIKDEEVRRIWD
ncbi:RNA-directed DNA polymerase [Dysgonomonas sp. PH5-45]|uniref:reverse transcriptase/maturase family protein n=1 Tax=unclassified Dysgonomonas TaxID=2630389 RepID=UPI002475F98C|nr:MULTISPECIES: reverse transcriptase/maturase family protein [unclassified Dysgonomonas]MDH6355448.1 RNA-directed DNA polymerase [Dysgonomonas sp. PH5-45]MDH6388345.1 RNA-directed DNA polymerase [Dysgonomonas sp. PH5-37]